MAPSITTNKELIAHYSAYAAIIGLATTGADDLAPYFAPSIEANDRIITREEFRALIPPDTEISIERIVADVERRILTSRLRIHVPAMNMRMIEHVFYDFDESWKIHKVARVYAVLQLLTSTQDNHSQRRGVALVIPPSDASRIELRVHRNGCLPAVLVSRT
ncbi:hypothetical protein C8R47DRAFT_1163401 [Mycena vitilis]|nr:hypothetical protein C8R47DRAFT_1163401 [Mycena vitilis]